MFTLAVRAGKAASKPSIAKLSTNNARGFLSLKLAAHGLAEVRRQGAETVIQLQETLTDHNAVYYDLELHCLHLTLDAFNSPFQIHFRCPTSLYSSLSLRISSSLSGTPKTRAQTSDDTFTRYRDSSGSFG